MLPQKRAAAAADAGQLPAHRQPSRQKETRVRHLVHQLHDGGGFQRREGQQNQEARHKLRPDKKREAHPGHARGAQLNDRGDEIHRAQQARRDDENHAGQPEDLPVGGDHRGQRRIGGPARLGRAARNEEAGEHDDTADDKRLVTGHVEAREGHVRRADLQRDDEIGKRHEGQGHDRQKHHDRPVHRPEGIVEVWR